MSTPGNNGHYDVLWPRSPRQVRRKAPTLAARLGSLNGKVVAQLWDYVFRGDEVYTALEEGLKARFPEVRFVNWNEFGNIHGSDERQVVAALPQRLKELKVDAVMSAMAA
jgi:hypothetical protein